MTRVFPGDFKIRQLVLHPFTHGMESLASFQLPKNEPDASEKPHIDYLSLALDFYDRHNQQTSTWLGTRWVSDCSNNAQRAGAGRSYYVSQAMTSLNDY